MKFKYRYIIILIVFIIAFPAINLSLTNSNVSKSLLSNNYYLKITSEESEFTVLKQHLRKKGWQENENKRMGGLYVFEKNEKEKEITNDDIRTLILDGKLNLQHTKNKFIDIFFENRNDNLE